jgi:hypothetical protein
VSTRGGSAWIIVFGATAAGIVTLVSIVLRAAPVLAATTALVILLVTGACAMVDRRHGSDGR